MTNTRALISIVTVSYNSGLTIEQTIQSVLNQTYNNIEYVIIDGGSTDTTLNIIDSFKERFIAKGIKLKVISEPDKGIYDAMNKGLKICEGSWIGIINSDDFYEQNAVEVIWENLNNNPSAELIYGNITLIDESGNHKVASPVTNLNMLMQTMTIFHPTVFVKSTVYEKLGAFNLKYKLCADWDLILRFYVKGINFHYVNQKIAFFRAGGAGSGLKIIHLKERASIRKMHSTHKRLWYDFKDFLIFIYFKISSKTSLD